MKICILSAVNIRHMTLISLYTDRFKKAGIKYDIVYMDKYGEDEHFEAENKFVYKNIIKQSQPKIVKALKYFRFRKYAIKKIEQNNYDFIIVWNDVAIFMFANYLAKKWKGKYCLNIRDYLFQEKMKWIYNRFDRVIKNSAFTTISSDGYKKFLPKHDYIHVHSLNMQVLEKIKPRTSLRENDKPIRIAFIGYVRYFQLNQKLMQVFKNDERFELHYYGTKADVLKEFANANNIKNTKFHDTFPVSETHKFLEEVDLINNLYGNNTPGLRYALSIKLYHGTYQRTPILFNKNTWGEKIVNQYGIGYVVNDISNDIKDDIFNWYTNLNFEEFSLGCENFLTKIETDNLKFERVFFNKFLS